MRRRPEGQFTGLGGSGGGSSSPTQPATWPTYGHHQWEVLANGCRQNTNVKLRLMTQRCCHDHPGVTHRLSRGKAPKVVPPLYAGCLLLDTALCLDMAEPHEAVSVWVYSTMGKLLEVATPSLEKE